MIRQVVIFFVAAGVGAVLALLVRSTWHHPYHEPAEEMSAPAKPHTHSSAEPAATPPVDPHAGHTSALTVPVNDICAICGMDVDPTLPTAKYQGKVIGFACMKCPPKFTADPERYGPHYLRNEKVP